MKSGLQYWQVPPYLVLPEGLPLLPSVSLGIGIALNDDKPHFSSDGNAKPQHHKVLLFPCNFLPPPNCLDGEPFATSPSISNKEKKTVFLETPLGRFSLMYSLPFGTRLSVQFTSGMGSLQIMQPLPLAEDHFELCLACRFQQQTPNDQFK